MNRLKAMHYRQKVIRASPTPEYPGMPSNQTVQTALYNHVWNKTEPSLEDLARVLEALDVKVEVYGQDSPTAQRLYVIASTQKAFCVTRSADHPQRIMVDNVPWRFNREVIKFFLRAKHRGMRTVRQLKEMLRCA